MTERGKEWASEWLKPGILIQFVLFILLCGGFYASFHALEKSVGDMRLTVGELQKNQTTVSLDLVKSSADARVELVKYQEEIKALSERLLLVEKAVGDQAQINTGLFNRMDRLNERRNGG